MSNFKQEWVLLEEKKNEKFSKKPILTLPNNVKVFLIDGKYIRNHYEVDFIGGGHIYVPYDFIPENEIWIEDLKKDKKEFIALLIHEFTERMLMKYFKLSYEDGHKIATQYETIFRRQYDNKTDKIGDVLNLYFKKYFTNDPFYNNDFSNKLETHLKNINMGE